MNKFFSIILIYNTVLVLPYSDMNPPRVYMRSQTWTPLPPPSPQHLSGSSPCTSPKHAAPYVRHGLAIQFLHDSIHVRIPIRPNHPTLSLSLWVQKKAQKWEQNRNRSSVLDDTKINVFLLNLANPGLLSLLHCRHILYRWAIWEAQVISE